MGDRQGLEVIISSWSQSNVGIIECVSSGYLWYVRDTLASHAVVCRLMEQCDDRRFISFSPIIRAGAYGLAVSYLSVTSGDVTRWNENVCCSFEHQCVILRYLRLYSGLFMSEARVRDMFSEKLGILRRTLRQQGLYNQIKRKSIIITSRIKKW